MSILLPAAGIGAILAFACLVVAAIAGITGYHALTLWCTGGFLVLTFASGGVFLYAHRHCKIA